MPAFLMLPPHLPVAELEARYRGARDPVARSHWQILWLLATEPGRPGNGGGPGHRLLGQLGARDRPPLSPGWPRRRGGSPPSESGQRGITGCRRESGPGHGPRRFRPDGGLWTGRQVATWLSTYLGRAISPQRGWEYLRQVGGTPQQPRPIATQADPGAQAAFKNGGSAPPSLR